MKPNVLVFDIETIADLTPENRDAVGALAKKRDVAPEDYAGLCPPLARVACIAWFDLQAQALGALVDGTLCPTDVPSSIPVANGATGQAIPCAVSSCAGEAAVLRSFGRLVAQQLGRAHGQLVTYNGRGFDLPVLLHRSFKHGVTEGRELLLKAMGENRFRPLLHLDLQDVVTFFGASPRWPMAAYALGYGWGSPKEQLDGSQVWSAVQAGRTLDVVRYCASDVLATTHVYRTMHD